MNFTNSQSDLESQDVAMMGEYRFMTEITERGK